jgi:hypothetical protein
MVERSLEQMTLREKLTEAERLTRELIDHLDQGFLPRCHDLSRLVRPINGEPPALRALEDVTVRTQVAHILESETFTESLFQKLSTYCQAIDEAVGRIQSEG